MKRYFEFVSIFILLLISPTLLAQKNEGSVISVVTKISETPRAGTGIIATWIEIVGNDVESNQKLGLYLQYMGKNQRIPQIEERCIFKYRSGPVNGIVGTEFTELKDAKVIYFFRCY